MGAVDGEVVHEGDCEAVGGTGVNFEYLLFCGGGLGQEELAEIDGVGCVVDDELEGEDFKTCENGADEIECLRASGGGCREDSLHKVADGGGCVDRKLFFFRGEDKDCILCRLYNFLKDYGKNHFGHNSYLLFNIRGQGRV